MSGKDLQSRLMMLKTRYLDATGACLSNKLCVNVDHIYTSKAHRIAKTENPYTDDKIMSRKMLGHFTANGKITAQGIEEADHVYWVTHPDRFQETFGVPLKGSSELLPQEDYDKDPMEMSATQRIAEAIKPLNLCAFQIGG